MQWIKHDTNANMDAKLQIVLLDYGLEGYGLFWYCVELIGSKVSQKDLTFALEHDARIIARNTGSSTQKVQDIMTRFVDLGLFEMTNGKVTCFNLAKRLDQSMTSNKSMRALIDQIKVQKVNSHDSVKLTLDGVMQEENRIEEKRREEKRENKKHIDQSKIDRQKLADQENEYLFDMFWESGLRKVKKKESRKSFYRIMKTKKDYQTKFEFTSKIIAHISAALIYQQYGYDKIHPSSFLNGERWDDEITGLNSTSGIDETEIINRHAQEAAQEKQVLDDMENKGYFDRTVYPDDNGNPQTLVNLPPSNEPPKLIPSQGVEVISANIDDSWASGYDQNLNEN